MKRGPIKNTLENRGIVLKYWGEGKNATEISELTGVNRNLVRKMLQSSGVDTSLQSSFENKLYKGEVRDIFTEGCEFSEYFLGFLLADGCVYEDRLILEIQKRDSHVLHSFVQFLSMDVNVRSYEKKCGSEVSSISVRSPRLASEISKYGIIPRKTGIEKAPIELSMSSSFWRGVVDGDGCITLSKNNPARVYLCGTDVLCQQFLNFCKGIAPDINSNIRKESNIYRATISGKNALLILRELYSESSVHLNRKFNKYLEIEKAYA